MLTESLVEQVLGYRRFNRMKLQQQDVLDAATGCNRYSKFVSNLYALQASKAGKRLSGEKTPDFCRTIPVLHRLFPHARFVHIIRDGRNTALSTLDWAVKKGPAKWGLWGRDPVAVCALWWHRQAGTGIQEGRKLGPAAYHEIHYEKLVEDPVRQLQQVANFLDIPDAREMAEFHKGRTSNNPNLSAKSAWLPATPGLRDWREQLPPEDVSLFEAISGELLSELGYELADYPQTAAVSERVTKALEWWSNQRMANEPS